MKRRDFLLNTAGLTGVLMPVVGRGQSKPCPPGTVSVGGGTSLTSSCNPGNAVSDWKSRSTAPGVVWAHDFSDPEEARAWRYSSQDSLAPTRAADWQDIAIDPSVSAPGTSRALVHRIIGTTLAQPIDATSTRVFLTDVSEFPDPGVVGAYGGPTDPYVLLGTGGNVAEGVRVIAKGPNYVDLVRPTVAQGAKAHAVGEAFSLDAKNSWNRPLGAFNTPKNGKLTPDIGIANGFKDRSADWRYNYGQFRGAWWGHNDYRALYHANWPTGGFDTGSWYTYTNTFDGNEFWLQYRQKVSASRLASNMPRGKLNYIQNCSSSTAQQFYFLVKPDLGRRLYLAHDGQSAFTVHPKNIDGGEVPTAQWLIEPDVWETFMFHIKPGHTPYSPDSTVELFAAREGDASWTTLMSRTDFNIHFYSPAANYGEVPAYNNFQPRNNPNHYQGSSGGGSCPRTNYVAYTQIILSSQPIALPT